MPVQKDRATTTWRMHHLSITTNASPGTYLQYLQNFAKSLTSKRCRTSRL